MKKRLFSIFTALALLFSTLPVNALAVGNSGAGGLCEHHPSHTAECGYAEGAEGTPCNHEHTEDCDTLVEKCVHEHTEDCYPADSVSDNTATPSDAEDREPTECTHVCSEDTGCIKETLDCQHEHDDDCGYIPATKGTPCTFVCEICGEESSEQEENTKAKDAKCICESLCTGEKFNTDCPVCGVEDADLTLCKGEAVQAQQITITGFDELPEEVQAQIIPVGTKLADLNLPDKLGASGYVGMQDSGGAEPLTIEGVTWKSDPAYDENTEGSWLFTAKLPKGYILLDSVELPQIGVMAEPVNLLAETASGDFGENNELHWSLDDSGTLTILGTGSMPDYEAYTNLPWNVHRDKIKTVVVNSGVTSIGEWAFSGCTNLKDVTLPDNLRSIGEYAFRDCSSLVQIKLPTGLSSIENHTFYGCTSLESVILPDNLQSIGAAAFGGCISLALTELPADLSSIGDVAFDDCISLALTELPTGLSSIGQHAFNGCINLALTELPTDLSSIGNYAFKDCKKLTELIFTSMTAPTLGTDVFNGCDNLTTIYIPENATGYDGPNWPTDKIKQSKTPVPYRTCDENGQNWETAYCTTYTIVKDNAWKDGWYVIDKGPVVFHDRIVIQGDVRLILKDNVFVKAAEGIRVDKNSSLTIYAQSTGVDMGSLTAATIKDNFAGIGGGHINTSGLSMGEDGGNITIYGGKIDAQGGRYGAGIGGGSGDGGNTTIYGGIVNATGGESSAGIGGGYWGSSGTVIIRGGDVTAAGSGQGAGIGTGTDATRGEITIWGGTVDAKSGSSAAAAIGGSDVTIDIRGGTVTATHANANVPNGTGVGIGGTVNISGGFVTATGGGNFNSAGGIDGKFSTAAPGNAVIVANKITGQFDESSLSGVIIVGFRGQLYGQNVTPTDDFTIPDTDLTIPAGSTLTIQDNITAINKGKIYKYGAIEGTITNEDYGKILEESSITVFVSGSSSGDSITEALYGDSFYVNAIVEKAVKNRAAYEGSVVFYVQMGDAKISLGRANVTGGRVQQYVYMNGGQWKDKWWKPGSYTITAELQNSDILMKCNGETTLTIVCDHKHNTTTTDDCTASVQCSICQDEINATSNEHNFMTRTSNNNGTTHTGKDCTNITCTGGVCTQTKIEDCSGGTATCTQRARCDKCGAEYGSLEVHSMTHHAAQGATCISAGAKEYWSCDVCGKNFADADGKTELQDVVIPKLGHDWDNWQANNDGTHSRICKRNSSHTETDSCSFGADDRCTICGGNKPVVTYTITFDSQGGSSVSNQSIASGGKVAEPANPKKNGFTFAGWYNGGAKWDFAKDIVTGDLTLTAHWTADTPTPAEKYSVTVQTNGNGTASASPSSAESGKTITLTAQANPGYHFKEWQVISGNVTISGNSFHMPANDVTVKAIFEKNASPDPGHTHSWAAEWSSNAAQHWHECSCGGKSDAAAHSFRDWITDREATEDTAGAKHRNCTVCNYREDGTIPKKEPSHTHTHNYTSHVTKAAACETQGVRTYTCSCGDSYTEKIAALGHDYVGNVTKEPTVSAEGIRTYTCQRCGSSYTEAIPKLPSPQHIHSYTARETKKATCTKTGTRLYQCACGDSYTESIPATGHSYQPKVTKEPTISSEGVMTYTCGRCGSSYTEPIKRIEDTSTSSDPADRPEPGIPFIKDDYAKNGWEAIKEETDRTKDKGTVTVDMNGASVVPGNVLEHLRGRDITIVFDMGDGILWSVDGKSIRDGSIGDIDFTVEAGTMAIPVGIVNNLTGERYSIQISLAHNGEFGFTAVLDINLDKKNAGLYASLYHYNADSGILEHVCSEQIAEDGTVRLKFTHASDYLIVIDQKPAEGTESPAPSGDAHDAGPAGGNAAPASPQTGDSWKPMFFITIMIVSMLFMAGFGGFMIWKRKKENGEP